MDQFLGTKVGRQFAAGRWRRSRGFAEWEGGVAEDGAGAVGVEAVEGGGALRGLAAQAQGACGKATVLVDFEGRAEAEDAGPPGALWGGAKDGAIFLLGAWPGGARSPAAAAVPGAGAEVRGVEFVEPGTTKAAFGGGAAGRQRALAEGTKDFADVRGSEAAKELLTGFSSQGRGQSGAPGGQRRRAALFTFARKVSGLNRNATTAACLATPAHALYFSTRFVPRNSSARSHPTL